MRTFVGIDPGVSPVLCFLVDGKIKFIRFHTSNQKQLESVWPKWRIERLRLDTIQVGSLIAFNKIPGNKVVGLEGVAYGMKYRVATMAKIEHVLQGVWERHMHMEWMYMVAPPTWKKITIGKGNASKKEIKSVLMAKYPQLGTKKLSQDHFDALGIALATRRMWNEIRPATAESLQSK